MKGEVGEDGYPGVPGVQGMFEMHSPHMYCFCSLKHKKNLEISIKKLREVIKSPVTNHSKYCRIVF